MHKVVKAVTVGSVGDLGRIARRLADAGYNINAVGGGEGSALNGTVGIISLLVTPDHHDDQILELLQGMPLDGNRTLEDVQVHAALDVELVDEPGQLAKVGELLGEAEISILGVQSVDVHLDWAHVSLAFESVAVRNTAQDVLVAGGIRVLPEHGARRRRAQVDRILRGIKKGDEIPEED
jgi:hypothetical protein